jgi:hypothetical protein
MSYFWIFPYYLGWHYGRGIVEYLTVFINFMTFVPRFFSIGTLFRTLLSPFQRLKEHYQGGLELENLAEVLVVNIMMRLVGLVVRSFIIAIGLIATVFTFVIGIFLFILWILLPAILIFLFIISLIGLFPSTSFGINQP